MKKLIKFFEILMLMLVFTGVINSTDVKAVSVRDDGSINVTLCESEVYIIAHPGEAWVINGTSDIGDISLSTDAYADTPYCTILSQYTYNNGDSCAFVKFKKGAGTYKTTKYWHQYWIEYRNIVNNKLHRYYFNVYENIKDIYYSDNYLNNNKISIGTGEIYMYEGDMISTDIKVYNSSTTPLSFVDISFDTTETEFIPDPNGVGYYLKPTSNISLTKLNSGRYLLEAVKEGDYLLGITVRTDSNGGYNGTEYVYRKSIAHYESFTIKVRKKPVITLPSDVYMSINSSKDIVCEISGLESLNGVHITWDAGNTPLISLGPNSNKLNVISGTVTGSVNVTATYTDDVNNHNPYHSPEMLICTLHVENEKVDIKTPDGTDILKDGVVLNGSSITVNVSIEDGAVAGISSKDVSIANATYNNGVITIKRVATGATSIVLTTRTGTEYEFPITVNADAPVINAVAGADAAISWSEAFGAVSYDVYRCDTPDGIYKKIGNTNKLTYTDATATYGKTYYYKVISVANNTEYSSVYSNAVACKNIPATPTVKSVTKSGKQYKVTMSCMDSCDGYEIYVDSKLNPVKAKGSTTTNSATITLDAGTWYVRARSYVTVSGEKVYSAYSENVKVTVSKDGSVETVKSAANVKATKVKLTVKKVKGAKKYQVKYSTSKKFKKKNTKTITKKKNTMTIKKLKKNKKYYYKYRTYKKVNGKYKWSKWSKAKRLK